MSSEHSCSTQCPNNASNSFSSNATAAISGTSGTPEAPISVSGSPKHEEVRLGDKRAGTREPDDSRAQKKPRTSTDDSGQSLGTEYDKVLGKDNGHFHRLLLTDSCDIQQMKRFTTIRME